MYIIKPYICCLFSGKFFYVWKRFVGTICTKMSLLLHFTGTGPYILKSSEIFVLFCTFVPDQSSLKAARTSSTSYQIMYMYSLFNGKVCWDHMYMYHIRVCVSLHFRGTTVILKKGLFSSERNTRLALFLTAQAVGIGGKGHIKHSANWKHQIIPFLDVDP